MGISRINAKFEQLNSEGRAGLVTFTTAGDPDYNTALNILRGLPGAGAECPFLIRWQMALLFRKPAFVHLRVI